MRRSERVFYDATSPDSRHRGWEMDGPNRGSRSAGLGQTRPQVGEAPVRKRVAERHRRVRFDESGRVVEDHQAIRLVEEYDAKSVSDRRPLRFVVVWSALVGLFVSVSVAGAYLGGWAALAVGLGWVVLIGSESAPLLALYWVLAAVLSVLLQSYWGAILVALAFSLTDAEVDEDQAGRSAE